MAEIAYLMGKDEGSNKYFKSAKAYFTAKFKGDKQSVVVTPKPFTLDAVLTDLAKRTTTYDVVHVVTHAGPQGMLFFGLSSDIGYSDIVSEDDLQTALDTWDNAGHPGWTPLWARKAGTGGTPVSVGDGTIIQIDGCDIGLCPTFCSSFGEMFAREGTIRAAVRPAVFAVDTKQVKPPLMGQARQRMLADRDMADFPPKDKVKRAAYDTDFAQRYFDRLLASDEVVRQFMVDTLKTAKAAYVAHVHAVATSAGTFFENPVKPWYIAGVFGRTVDVPRVIDDAQALELGREMWPAASLEPKPLFAGDVLLWDDSNCPFSLWRADPKADPEELEMDDPENPGTKVDGTRVKFELPVAQLFEPILDAAGTWLREVHPDEPSEYAEIVFRARSPKKP